MLAILLACNSAAATPTVNFPATVTPQPSITPSPTAEPDTPVPASTPTFTPSSDVRVTPSPIATVPPTPTIAPTRVVLRLPNVADTVEDARGAVVSIVSEVTVTGFFGPQASFESGTGIIFTPDGFVLTNNHVIENAAEITVTLDDGQQMTGEVVGADRLSDLAVLRIPDGEYPFLPLTPGDPDDKLRVGEWVIAIGNALALPGGPTVTVGVVSALGRSIETNQGVTLYDLIQTDTVINPGNSGGPLISLAGELVGVNTAVQRRSQGGELVEGIGFAINRETAAQVAKDLISLGRVRWSGPRGVCGGDIQTTCALPEAL